MGSACQPRARLRRGTATPKNIPRLLFSVTRGRTGWRNPTRAPAGCLPGRGGAGRAGAASRPAPAALKWRRRRRGRGRAKAWRALGLSWRCWQPLCCWPRPSWAARSAGGSWGLPRMFRRTIRACSKPCSSPWRSTTGRATTSTPAGWCGSSAPSGRWVPGGLGLGSRLGTAPQGAGGPRPLGGAGWEHSCCVSSSCFATEAEFLFLKPCLGAPMSECRG